MTNKNSDELWDIYTKDRSVTGDTHLRGNQMNAGEYHIVVHVCIFNHKNQLLIQQRQPFKRGWPNMWDLSACGSALAGENSCEAAARETAEELGLIIDFSDKRPHFTINFAEGFDDYYILEQDIDLAALTLQESEVKDVRWAEKKEVLKLQEEGTMVPYWFLDKLFEIRGAYDAHGKNHAKIRIDYASPKNLASSMSLVEILAERLSVNRTAETITACRNTMIKHINKKSALCALDKNMVVGILLFSAQENRLLFLAVHPGYRRQKIAAQMADRMFDALDTTRDITAETFREGDEKGDAPRAFLQSLGFVPGNLCLLDGGYPGQQFVRKGTSAKRDGAG